MAALIVVVTLTPLPGRRDAMRDVLAQHWPDVQREEGCELYALHENDDVFVAVERWSSREIWERHLATEGNMQLGEELRPLLAEPLQVYDVVAVPLGDPSKNIVR